MIEHVRWLGDLHDGPQSMALKQRLASSPAPSLSRKCGGAGTGIFPSPFPYCRLCFGWKPRDSGLHGEEKEGDSPGGGTGTGPESSTPEG